MAKRKSRTRVPPLMECFQEEPHAKGVKRAPTLNFLQLKFISMVSFVLCCWCWNQKASFFKKEWAKKDFDLSSFFVSFKKIANAANLTFKKSQTREKKNVLARALHHCENIYLTYNGLNHVLMYGMTSLGMTMLKNWGVESS